MPDANFVENALRQLAGLFEGLSRKESMQLLAALERAGAAVYQGLAEDEQDADIKASLLRAAEKEIENAEVLEGRRTSAT